MSRALGDPELRLFVQGCIDDGDSMSACYYQLKALGYRISEPRVRCCWAALGGRVRAYG